MNNKEHLCSRSGFYNASQIHKEIYMDIQTAYLKSQQIYNTIKESEVWSGKNKEAWLENMEAILSLHNRIPKGADEVFCNMVTTMDAMVNDSDIISRLGD